LGRTICTIVVIGLRPAQVFENLEFDRPASLRGVKRTALTFEVQPPAANGDTAAADGEEAAEKAQRDKDQSDTGNGENGEEAERPGGLLFAGFACYMEVDLAKPGAIEVDTLRDDTHWAQQLLLFGATTVWAVRPSLCIAFASTFASIATLASPLHRPSHRPLHRPLHRLCINPCIAFATRRPCSGG
jgi:hypothetical protein